MPEAFIYDAVRTPRGRGRPDGALHEVTALALAAGVLRAVRDRSEIDTGLVEDVILGCVTAAGEQGGNIARGAALYAGYAETCPGLHINRFCASGLEAVNLAANQIKAGVGSLYVAGGVESMSRTPMGSDGFPMAVDPYLAFAAHFVPQGIAADLIATRHGFTREQCDAYAVESQRRAAAAWEDGRFDRSVTPVRDVNGVVILARDEHMRPETDLAGLAALRPSFKEIGETMPGFDAVALLKYPDLERVEHVHHAGNSSGIVDGAAAVLIGDRATGEALGLRPRARIVATARVGSDPTIMLTGPVPAAEKALKAAGMTIGDIDLFEVNEAFSAVVLRFLQAFDLDPAKVNVNGGAIALGHPLGATGAMILGTALDELERTGRRTALVTLCVAAGMGAATIIERV
ncbi:MAG: acetyl-CoA C-acetyltransferase [Rhodobacteraceae bacterium]|nr:MAG: acetyl-CoA C-acetyltransferase [Paracoccaceae bacterium]